MTIPTCPIVASRDKPALVLSMESGFMYLNQKTVARTERIIQVIIWAVCPIDGNSQRKTQTKIAPMPNQSAAKAGSINSDRIKAIPNTNQCHGSKINSIHFLFVLVMNKEMFDIDDESSISI